MAAAFSDDPNDGVELATIEKSEDRGGRAAGGRDPAPVPEPLLSIAGHSRANRRYREGQGPEDDGAQLATNPANCTTATVPSSRSRKKPRCGPVEWFFVLLPSLLIGIGILASLGEASPTARPFWGGAIIAFMVGIWFATVHVADPAEQWNKLRGGICSASSPSSSWSSTGSNLPASQQELCIQRCSFFLALISSIMVMLTFFWFVEPISFFCSLVVHCGAYSTYALGLFRGGRGAVGQYLKYYCCCLFRGN